MSAPDRPPAEPPPDLVVHAGMPHTGGTMLSRNLARVRPQLRAHGVAYLGHDQLLACPAVTGWAADPSQVPAHAAVFVEQVAELVDRERTRTAEAAEDGAARTLLVSSQALLGRHHVGRDDAEVFRPYAVPAITQLIDAVGASRVRVYVQLRRQDRLMEYAYIQELMRGQQHSFPEQFPYRFKPRLDYRELLDRVAAIPQVIDVVARPIEFAAPPLTRTLDDVLGTVGLAGALTLPGAEEMSLGRVYTARGMRIARAMNAQLDWSEERGLVRDFVLAHFGSDREPDSRFLPIDERSRILKAHAGRNRALFQKYLPGTVRSGYVSVLGTENMIAATLGTDPDDLPNLTGRQLMAIASRKVRMRWGRLVDH